MKRLLITGFDPFGGGSVNPSWEAVSRLPDRVGEYELRKLAIPTLFGKAAELVLDKAREFQPHVIIGIAPVLPAFLDEDSTVICSGILDVRLNDVTAALTAAGLTVTSTRAKEDWRCVTAKRRIQ